MYQTLIPCGEKEACCLVFSWTTKRVPGGARGVRLKLKLQRVAAYAERLGWRREDSRIFNVMPHCGNNLSHSWIGKFGSSVAISDRK